MSTFGQGREVGVLPWTLSGAPGVGPARERALWLAGGWADGALAAAAEHVGLGSAVVGRLLEHRNHINKALEANDFKGIFYLLPTRERWRVLPMVLPKAAAVDIETDGPEITAMSVWTQDRAVSWAPGLGQPPLDLLASADAVLSFNGAAFDLPIISSTWKDCIIPSVHIDVLAMTRRMNVRGGLKLLEKRAGWERPASLDGMDGAGAVGLWQRWKQAGDRKSLAMLLEYNLEDAFSLPYLAAWCHDRLVERVTRAAAGAPPVPPLWGPQWGRDQGALAATRTLMAALDHLA